MLHLTPDQALFLAARERACDDEVHALADRLEAGRDPDEDPVPVTYDRLYRLLEKQPQLHPSGLNRAQRRALRRYQRKVNVAQARAYYEDRRTPYFGGPYPVTQGVWS